jgi:hypothetical protein
MNESRNNPVLVHQTQPISCSDKAPTSRTRSAAEALELESEWRSMVPGHIQRDLGRGVDAAAHELSRAIIDGHSAKKGFGRWADKEKMALSSVA